MTSETTPSAEMPSVSPVWETIWKWIVWVGLVVMGFVAVWVLWRVCWWLMFGDISVTGPVALGLVSLAVVYFAVRREHRFRLRREAVLELSDIYSRVMAAAGGNPTQYIDKKFRITRGEYHRAQFRAALFLPQAALRALVNNRKKMLDNKTDAATMIALVRALRKAGGQPTWNLKPHHLLGLYINDIFPGDTGQDDKNSPGSPD